MAKAKAYNTPTPDLVEQPKKEICETAIRLQLRRAGLRLERQGYGYRIIYRSQVLMGSEFEMSLADVSSFANGALLR
jgi:hypothetical protein